MMTARNLEMPLSSGSSMAVVPTMVGMTAESQVIMRQGPFCGPATTSAFLPSPPGLGSLPQFLAFLLFWFKKTKPGSVVWKGGEGDQATPFMAEEEQ